MFENQSQPVLPFWSFLGRVGRAFVLGGCLIAIGLAIGTLGYHLLAGLPWLDAALNAAMILTGMGPVDRLTNPAAKVFAIVYSLFSSVVVLGASGLLIAPVFHRILHQLKVDED